MPDGGDYQRCAVCSMQCAVARLAGTHRKPHTADRIPTNDRTVARRLLHLDDANVGGADIYLDVAFGVPVRGTADACLDSPAVDGQPLVPAGEYRSPAQRWAGLVGEARLGGADVMDRDLVLEDGDVLEADPSDVVG